MEVGKSKLNDFIAATTPLYGRYGLNWVIFQNMEIETDIQLSVIP